MSWLLDLLAWLAVGREVGKRMNKPRKGTERWEQRWEQRWAEGGDCALLQQRRTRPSDQAVED